MQKDSFSDLDVWSRLQNGEQKALEELYFMHIDALANYGKRFTPDSTLIEDSIHDLFVIIWQSRENLAKTTSVKNYLLGSLRNNLIKSLNQSAKTTMAESFDQINFNYDLTVEEVITTSEKDLELKQSINNQLNKLASRQKEAIYLKYFEDRSYDEICELMDINYQSVRNLISTGLKKLKEML